VLLVALLLAGFALLGSRLTPEQVQALLDELGPWSAFVSVTLMVLHSFVPFPAELLACANGALFGPWWGALVTWSGAMLGAVSAFSLARRYGPNAVAALTPPRYREPLYRWAEFDSSRPFLLFRLVPVIAFNLVNYAAGLSRLGWWAFLWTTGLGILPMTFLTAFLGEEITKLPAAMNWIWTAVALFALWWALRHWRGSLHRERNSAEGS